MKQYGTIRHKLFLEHFNPLYMNPENRMSKRERAYLQGKQIQRSIKATKPLEQLFDGPKFTPINDEYGGAFFIPANNYLKINKLNHLRLPRVNTKP